MMKRTKSRIATIAALAAVLSTVGCDIAGTVQIWNLRAKAAKRIIPVACQSNARLLFSPSGKHLAIAGQASK